MKRQYNTVLIYSLYSHHPFSYPSKTCSVKARRRLSQYRYLSCTFCLMSTRFSWVISRSRYSESISVADSRSFWLSWNEIEILIICFQKGNGKINLENSRVIIFLEKVSKYVGVHQYLSAFAQNIHSFFHKLNLMLYKKKTTLFSQINHLINNVNKPATRLRS